MIVCQDGHPMAIRHQFTFAHAPDDSPAMRAQLDSFEALGLELGAEVTVWYCSPCDFAHAEFAYPTLEAP